MTVKSTGEIGKEDEYLLLSWNEYSDCLLLDILPVFKDQLQVFHS